MICQVLAGPCGQLCFKFLYQIASFLKQEFTTCRGQMRSESDSGSNFPSQPGKVQIPHPTGTDDGPMPVGCPGEWEREKRKRSIFKHLNSSILDRSIFVTLGGRGRGGGMYGRILVVSRRIFPDPP